MFRLILTGLLAWAATQDPDEWRISGCNDFNWANSTRPGGFSTVTQRLRRCGALNANSG